jgi:formylglycine-generating enzyme required for sulfatase activity
VFCESGQAFGRVVFTTDAGLGKSKALEWLEYRLNLPDTGVLAFRFTVSELEGEAAELKVREQDFAKRFHGWLAGKLRQAVVSCPEHEAWLLIERARRQPYKLVLLIDGLDHVTQVPRLKLLLSSAWAGGVRIVLAGRPYSLQQHFTELGLQQGWKFIRLEEFEEQQQRRYLGMLANGDSRFERLPVAARAVLSIPRVLYYLRFKVSVRDFEQIRTAADVFWKAIRVMIVEGLRNSERARTLGRKDGSAAADVEDWQVGQCYQLLAVIAYTMTEQRRDHIPTKRLQDFWASLGNRYHTPAGNGLQQDTGALAALNDILEHGVFDTDTVGLQELQFRDKSLREFLTAWYLGQRADRSTAEFWWSRGVYRPECPATEDDYYVWQFLCELDREALLEERWLEAIEPLYRPGVQVVRDGQPVWTAARSCEMIFRSWGRLQELCAEEPYRKRACAIRDEWQGEFGRIVAGEQGEPRRLAAVELQQDLLLIPGGVLQMGSPREARPGIPDVWTQLLPGWYAGLPAADEDRAAYHESVVLSRLNLGIGKAAQTRREEWLQLVHELSRCATEAAMLQMFQDRACPWDEEPEVTALVIEDFLIGRSPVLNRWFRLFVPDHGPGDEYPDYGKYSDAEDQPAIYVDWFHAWCFSRWLFWEGSSCRLPWEQEWEYVAKYGNPWDWPYWWGDQWSDGAGRVTAQGHISEDATTVPTAAHASPATQTLDHVKGLGVMDLLGNVLEWCQDQYRQRHSHTAGDDPGSVLVGRVLRGGSFPFGAAFARCSYRGGNVPSGSGPFNGCRLARAAIRKP